MALLFILAFIGGCINIISKMVNLEVTKRLGTWNGTLINYITASLLSLIIIIFMGQSNLYNLSFFSTVPPYLFLGGVFGLIALLLTIITLPHIQVIYSTVIILIGQLGAGFVIDSVLSKSLSSTKIIGIVLVAAGVLWDKYIVNKQTTTI